MLNQSFTRNKKYGFTVTLPVSWKGYKILNDTWQSEDCSWCRTQRIERGPATTMRNPRWTVDRPWADIPIMIFTIAQSEELEVGEISLSCAAPVGPGELGRNAKYVFCLPTRYGLSIPGFDEVINHILAHESLQPMNLKRWRPAPKLAYINRKYGFEMDLPLSWKGYKVLERGWCQEETPAGKVDDTATCPIVVIRHPKWTDQVPREDIEIMIFTEAQWGPFLIGRIGVDRGPASVRQLAINRNYIFATLARDNYAPLIGWREVEVLLNEGDFHAF